MYASRIVPLPSLPSLPSLSPPTNISPHSTSLVTPLPVRVRRIIFTSSLTFYTKYRNPSIQYLVPPPYSNDSSTLPSIHSIPCHAMPCHSQYHTSTTSSINYPGFPILLPTFSSIQWNGMEWNGMPKHLQCADHRYLIQHHITKYQDPNNLTLTFYLPLTPLNSYN